MKRRLSPVACVAWLVLGCGTEVIGDASGSSNGGGGDEGGDGNTVVGGETVGGDSGGGSNPCAEPVSRAFVPGAYFFVVDVEAPLPTQLQLLAFFDVDPQRDTVRVRFTNADRSPGTSCGCLDDQACSSVDPDRCVLPSTRARTEDEYADFLVAEPDPPEGYSFTTGACTFDQVETVELVTAPADLVIEQPEVTMMAMQLTATCVAEPSGVARCNGTMTADEVLLGTAGTGPARGTLRARTIPEAEVPPDIPEP